MRLRLFITLICFCITAPAYADFDAIEADRTITGKSVYPTASEPCKVGKYPGRAKSGAGYFYDEVLEYRVWLHPKEGAVKRNGNNVYFFAFAQYEHALTFSQRSEGAEEPLVLIRQMKHVNEPSPGVFEIVEGERITEWKVEWLSGTKRVPGAIEKFIEEHRK